MYRQANQILLEVDSRYGFSYALKQLRSGASNAHDSIANAKSYDNLSFKQKIAFLRYMADTVTSIADINKSTPEFDHFYDYLLRLGSLYDKTAMKLDTNLRVGYIKDTP